jgi:simple sugar transport system permease protein
VLTHPEIGAVAAAIAIFIFFMAIAPAFRTLPSFSTVLYVAQAPNSRAPDHSLTS